MVCRGLLFLLLWLAGSGPLRADCAEALCPLAYDRLRAGPHHLVDLDALPLLSEPGHVFDTALQARGVALGEALAGQQVRTAQGFDRLTGMPRAPLALLAARPGRGLSVASHPGLGGNAVFPLGPAGAARIEGRGEGAMALLFTAPAAAFGWRLHADYDDPLGQRPPPGTAWLTAYDGDGRRRARLRIMLGHGPQPMAWTAGAEIRALSLETDDPGGIALDGIRYVLRALTG